MAQSDIWFPLYIGDYMADTLHLSTVEHGAYFLILCAYYKNHGPLPDDDQILSKIARLTHSDWLSVRLAIRSLFEIEAGMLVQRRADSEIEKIKKLQAAKREGARLTNQKLGRVSHSDTLSDSHSVVQLQSQSDKEGGKGNGASRRPHFSEKSSGRISSTERISNEKQIGRLEAAMRKIRDTYRGERWPDSAKAEMADLKIKHQELLDALQWKR